MNPSPAPATSNRAGGSPAPCAPGPTGAVVLPCEPSFIRAQIARLERAGLWEQKNYKPPPDPRLMMTLDSDDIYLIRIKDVATSRERIIYMTYAEESPTRSVRRLGRLIAAFINRTERGFVWRLRLHSFVRRFARRANPDAARNG